MQHVFRRPHHNAILNALRCFDGDLFERAECFFGGGTAIVLKLDEYRESIDIDFLCASKEGYRMLREAVWSNGFAGLVQPKTELRALRDLKTDHYGIRTILQIQNTQIKFEIVREARISLHGAVDEMFGIPVLDRVDMYTEKLLANADRWADNSILSRDMIDLSMMMSHWGGIPDEAWERARAAYGDSVRDAYFKAVERIRDPEWLRTCMEKMGIDPRLAENIRAPHDGPKALNKNTHTI